jgi:hypothetical protein
MLDSHDQRGYLALRKQFGPLTTRTSQDRLAATYRFILRQIDGFANRGDGNDWKRCLVCGIAWSDGAIAVSTRQLSLLIGRSKSSINTGLQAVGTSPASVDRVRLLLRTFPIFLGNCAGIRQWTIRAMAPPPAAKELAIASSSALWNQNEIDDLEDFRIRDDPTDDWQTGPAHFNLSD